MDAIAARVHAYVLKYQIFHVNVQFKHDWSQI